MALDILRDPDIFYQLVTHALSQQVQTQTQTQTQPQTQIHSQQLHAAFVQQPSWEPMSTQDASALAKTMFDFSTMSSSQRCDIIMTLKRGPEALFQSVRRAKEIRDSSIARHTIPLDGHVSPIDTMALDTAFEDRRV